MVENYENYKARQKVKNNTKKHLTFVKKETLIFLKTFILILIPEIQLNAVENASYKNRK